MAGAPSVGIFCLTLLLFSTTDANDPCNLKCTAELPLRLRGDPPDYKSRTVTLPNRPGDDVTCESLASQTLSGDDAVLEAEYGLNCMELQRHCCLCNTPESGNFVNTRGETCSINASPEGYKFIPSRKHPELEHISASWQLLPTMSSSDGSSRQLLAGDMNSCQQTFDYIRAVGCFETCDWTEGWSSVILLDHCSDCDDDETLTRALLIWLCGATLFGVVVSNMYVFILCSEPWYKVHLARERENSNQKTSQRKVTSYLLTSANMDAVRDNTFSPYSMSNQESSMRSSLADIPWTHVLTLTGTRTVGAIFLFASAALIGGLVGAVFIVDVVRIEYEHGFFSGSVCLVGFTCLFMIARLLREYQIYRTRPTQQRRKRVGTCSDRVWLICDGAVLFVMLLLALLAMWGCGPLSCFYCVRHIGKSYYDDDSVIDNGGLRFYCDRYVEGSQWHSFFQICIIIFVIGCPVDMLWRIFLQGWKAAHYRCFRLFFQATLHKCELATLIPVLTMGLILLSNNNAGEGDREGHCSRLAIFNIFILMNRVLRSLVFLSGVSVERIAKDQEEFEKRKLWPTEITAKKEKYNSRNIVRFQAYVDTKFVQLCLLVLQVGFGVLYFSASDELIPLQEEIRNASIISVKSLIRLLSFVLCFEMFAEIYIRCSAQGVELFFNPLNHKVEATLLLVIWFCSLYAWYFLGIHRDADEWVSWICMVATVLHRLVRFFGIKYKVSASGFDVQNLFDAKAMEKFEQYLGDILECAPQNVHIDVDDDIEISVVKATLKPEAFDGIHLPIVPEYALVEDLRISMQSPGLLFDANEQSEPNKVKIKNLLMIGVPGDGLASAKKGNGTNSDDDDYWDPEKMKEAKAKLVDMINKRLTAKPQAREESGSTSRKNVDSPGRFKSWMRRAKAKVKEKANELKRRKQQDIFSHVTVEITNVVFQFEDNQDCMACRFPLVNVRIGHIWVERKRDVLVRCDVHRISCRVENGGPRNLYSAASAKDYETPMDNTVTAKSTNSTRSTGNNFVNFSNLKRVVSNLNRARSMMHFNKLNSMFMPSTPKAVREPPKVYYHQALDPKQLVDQIERYNESEIVRLWGFEKAAEKSTKPLVNHYKLHKRNEHTADRNVVFSLLHVSFSGGPKDDLSDASLATEKMDPAQSSRTTSKGAASSDASGIIKRPWQWQTVTKPLRFKLDDEQMRVIMTIGSSMRSWNNRDNAQRWRPDLLPSEANPGTERKAVVWFWWMYAYHGVLSSLNIRSRRIGLDLLWRVQNCNLYKQVLRSVALRSRQGPNLRLDKIAPGEQADVIHLQSKLSLTDVIKCRKEVLQAVVNLQDEEGDEPSASERVPLKQQKTPVLPEASAASDSASTRKESVVKFADGSTATPQSTIDSGHTRQSTATSPSSATPPDRLSEIVLRSNGDWLFEIPAVEVHLLRYTRCPQYGEKAKPREIMIHMRSSQVFLDVKFSTDAKSVPLPLPGETLSSGQKLGRLSPHVSVTFSVDACGCVCPQAGDLVPGNRQHIFTITKPAFFRSPGHSDFVAGRRAGKLVSMAWRTAFDLDEEGHTSPLKMEFFLGEMRLIYPTPLKFAFYRFKSQEPSWDLKAGDGADFMFTAAELANSNVSGFEARYREQFEEFRRRKSHNYYKRFVGVPGYARDYHVDLDMQSINLQMQRYVMPNNSRVSVECYNFRPYCGSFRRGTTSDAIPRRMMTLEAFFGHRTGKKTWEKDFRQCVWQGNTDAQEDQRAGSAEHTPSEVEWIKRIVTTEMIKEGQLDTQYARWRTGTSGHNILLSGGVVKDTAPGAKLFSSVYFNDDDFSSQEMRTPWIARRFGPPTPHPAMMSPRNMGDSLKAMCSRWWFCRHAPQM